MVRRCLCLCFFRCRLLGGFWWCAEPDEPEGRPRVLFPNQRLLCLLVQGLGLGEPPDGRVEVAQQALRVSVNVLALGVGQGGWCGSVVVVVVVVVVAVVVGASWRGGGEVGLPDVAQLFGEGGNVFVLGVLATDAVWNFQQSTRQGVQSGRLP